MPSSATFSSAARPTNSACLSSLTTRPRPASYGFVSRPSSLPYSGMPASRRNVSRAPRPHAMMPAGCPAARRASHTGNASCPVKEELEAVLAGVAGARDERGLPAHVALGDRVVAQRAEVDVGQRRAGACCARALDGDQRGAQRRVVNGRIVCRRDVRAARRRRSRGWRRWARPGSDRRPGGRRSGRRGCPRPAAQIML